MAAPPDGGASGTARPLYGLAVVSAEIVVAVGEGGTILRSDGTAWTAIKSPSARRSWCGGEGPHRLGGHAGGTTIGSMDGGATWTAIAPMAAEKLTGGRS
jgi:hypothetical protein